MSRVLKQLFPEKNEQMEKGRPELRLVPPPPPVVVAPVKKTPWLLVLFFLMMVIGGSYLGYRVVRFVKNSAPPAIVPQKPLVAGQTSKTAEPADLSVSRGALHSYEVQDYPGALERLEALAKKYPDSAEILNNLAMVHLKMKEYPVAKKMLIEALQKVPEQTQLLARIYNNLGSLSLATRRFDDAVSYLQKTVMLDPGLLEGHFNLAVALENIGEPGAAAQEFEIYQASATRMDPLVKNRLSTRISKLKLFSSEEAKQ